MSMYLSGIYKLYKPTFYSYLHDLQCLQTNVHIPGAGAYCNGDVSYNTGGRRRKAVCIKHPTENSEHNRFYDWLLHRSQKKIQVMKPCFSEVEHFSRSCFLGFGCFQRQTSSL